MAKILITGGAGFIGSHLAEALLERGDEVWVLDNLSTGRRENITHLEDNDKFHFEKGDILDEQLVAELAQKVYSIERIRSLAIRARQLIYELGYYNVEIKVFDGTYGWLEEGPFEAIIVTAGAPEIPQPLIDQLSPGGRLVIPVGDAFVQDLIRVIKTEEGVKKEDLGGCRFVKLIGKYGWDEE